MRTPHLTTSTSQCAAGFLSLKTTVQPHVASTHLPAYNIIGAAPRPRRVEDDEPLKGIIRRFKPSSSISTSPSSSSTASLFTSSPSKTNRPQRGVPVTRENLSKVSMSCARDEDLDAPLSSSPSPSSSSSRSEPRRSASQSSVSSGSSSDLPSISEEEEEMEELAQAAKGQDDGLRIGAC